MDILTWSAIFVALFFFLYWYHSRPYSYWKDLGVPYVPGIPVFGSHMEVFRSQTHELEIKRYKKYGRIYGYYEGRQPALTIGDPDLIKDIFVKDFQYFSSRRDMITGDKIIDNMITQLNGETWKRVRSAITPAFSTGKIRQMTTLILDCATTLRENFEKLAKTGEPINVKKMFGAYTMDVIASTAFGTKVDSHNDPNNEFVSIARRTFSRNIPLRFIIFFFFPLIFKTFRLAIFSPKTVAFFTTVTLKIMEERKKIGLVRNDFLQLMMEAADEKRRPLAEPEEPEKEVSGQSKRSECQESDYQAYFKKGQRLHNQYEVLGQCITFFLAGYDTTASTLSFCCYLLALNPECQERLIEEIDNALKNNEGKLTYELVQSLKYLDQVVSETLRILPPGVRIERRCDDDYELGYTGVTVPKGMIVGIPLYAIHHDPEYYPDPEKFDPERFTPEAKAERHPYSYLPFGAGPRNCLGMRFALMEVKIGLTYVLSKFRVKRCPQTKVPLEFFVGQNLLQPKEILLSVERR